MTVSSVPLLQRIWLSWLLAFRVLFDGQVAARARALLELDSGTTSSQSDASAQHAVTSPNAASTPNTLNGAAPQVTQATNGALQLLSLLQREGRFVDFVQQDIAAFSDSDVGAAARVVHEGCQRALRSHARVQSVRAEAEGAQLTLDRAAEDVKLVGNVVGSAPFRGVLRHRGWRIQALELPTVVGTPDLTIVAAAELELS